VIKITQIARLERRDSRVAYAQVAKEPNRKSSCVNRPADAFGIAIRPPMNQPPSLPALTVGVGSTVTVMVFAASWCSHDAHVVAQEADIPEGA
jgi:hypothetical protein